MTIDGILIPADGMPLAKRDRDRVRRRPRDRPDDRASRRAAHNHDDLRRADDAETIAVDLLLVRRPVASNEVRRLPRSAVLATYARDRCLLDHLGQVREALSARRTVTVTVNLTDEALTAAAGARPAP